MRHAELTEQIIGAYYDVYNELGYGFLEKVYENALTIASRRVGLNVLQQAPITVKFDGDVVGEYFADLLVNGLVVVEIKAVERLIDAHEAQVLNYLKATGIEVGLLLNFGPSPEIKRKAFTQ